MKTKQVIVVRKDLNMRKGKMCSQASHVSMMFMAAPGLSGNRLAVELTEEQIDWLSSPFTKITCGIDSEAELLALAEKATAAGLVVHKCVDSGATEFNGVPTLTCIAIGPHAVERFARITDELKLL